MNFKTYRKVFCWAAFLASIPVSAQDFDSELQMSDGGTIYWYRICSAASGMEGFAMTDSNGHSEDGEDQENVLSVGISLLPTETDDYRSQWKLTAGEDGKIVITNRATGHQIDSTSNSAGDHNVTCLNFSSGAPGFTVTSLGDYAFKLESVEEDGVNRCLAAADTGSEAIAYPESGESTSCVGWKFFPVEIDTGIGSMKAGRPVVYVKDQRISVSGSEWQLFNAQGEEMPRTVRLATGVYLVKMPQKSVKVMIP